MWNLFHKSNEISVEIQGLDPNPKSIRHSDSKDFEEKEKEKLKQNFETVLQSVESGQTCFGKYIKITNFEVKRFQMSNNIKK